MSYFDLLPEELLTRIIFYIEEYQTLKNLPYSFEYVSNKKFWINLFYLKFGYLMDYISMPFLYNPNRNFDYNYIFNFYLKLIQSYKLLDEFVEYMEYNIRKKFSTNYPGISFDNIKSLEYDEVENFYVYSSFEGRHITDLSLISDINNSNLLNSDLLSMILVERGISYYAIVLYFKSVVVLRYILSFDQYKGLIFHIFTNGAKNYTVISN